MRDSDTVAVYFLKAMLHALRDRPDVRDAHLRAVGIDPQLLDQPQARVPAKAFAQLWLALIELLDDEFFRLDSHGMPPGSFALICRGVIHEPNLEKALRQCMGGLHDHAKVIPLQVMKFGGLAEQPDADPCGNDDQACRQQGEEKFLPQGDVFDHGNLLAKGVGKRCICLQSLLHRSTHDELEDVTRTESDQTRRARAHWSL